VAHAVPVVAEPKAQVPVVRAAPTHAIATDAVKTEAPAVAPAVALAVAPAAKQEPVAAPTAEAPKAAEAAVPSVPEAQPEQAPVAVAAPVEDTGPLPDAPSREQVSAAFEGLRTELEACVAGKHGIVTLDTTLAGAGRVSRALVDGIFRGTPEGSCMARAARHAHVPPFNQTSLNVTYTISL